MMRRFLPVGGGGGGGVEPSSSSTTPQRGEAEAAGLRFGGGDISLGPHGGGGGGGGHGHQLQDGSVDLLARHSSSPAGFFSNLMASNGFPGSKGGGGSGAEAHHHHHHPSMAGSGSGSSSGGRKMKSQLSFTAGPPHLSHIAEDGAFPDRAGAEASVPRTFSAGGSSGGGGFSIVGPWEESRDIISTLGGYESQFGGMASTSALEMAGMDRYLQLQHDQVPFKVRAKRGCATHPRSIAERERRTRISEKLRKLQELVPNMDKQTSTADMLDLAVEHIKGLQSQLQALKHEQEKCTCCSRP
ncbi:transcription factor bHLH128-like isoform X1 [Oryza glaberrima]|uniref:BHLH domain-containing protein n=3 Tax=Oryza TaxID=4527 RepID=A0A0E0G9K3_ORYNI|nr:transcription factor bHLH128-like isoform X1 [Oryza glaberrima]